MGVRVRKDLDEALRLNNTTGQVKKRLLNQAAKGMQKQFAESSTIEKGIAYCEPAQLSTVQDEYPVLKPITFTNIFEDDYLESLTWNLAN